MKLLKKKSKRSPRIVAESTLITLENKKVMYEAFEILNGDKARWDDWAIATAWKTAEVWREELEMLRVRQGGL